MQIELANMPQDSKTVTPTSVLSGSGEAQAVEGRKPWGKPNMTVIDTSKTLGGPIIQIRSDTPTDSGWNIRS